MSSLMLLLPLIAQAGASSSVTGIGSPYASALPIEIVEKKEEQARRAREAQNVDLPTPQGQAGCMAAVQANPEKTAEISRAALADAIGRERVRAGLCLGAALSDLGQWGDAREAFVAARDAADPEDHLTRARLGAMAGNAALADGDASQALLLLAPAQAAARQAGDADLIASIALDRARSLVAVNQPEEAARALADAREVEPANAQAWLLSATLSRRQNKLIEAQAQIEKAAELSPRDPAIGVEAGVISVLSGNDTAARRSWNSVLSLAPGSAEAKTAQGYLDQLGPVQAVSKTTP